MIPDRRYSTLFVVTSLCWLLGCAAGCAWALPPSMPRDAVLPDLPGRPPATIAIGVVDQRPYILSGNKEPWFESLVRNFGSPAPLARFDDSKHVALADRLASVLRDAFEKGQSQVALVAFPPGTLANAADAQLSGEHQNRALLLEINESRFDQEVQASRKGWAYTYDFQMRVLGADGSLRAQATEERGKEYCSESDRCDMPLEWSFGSGYDMTYKKVIEALFENPSIETALFAQDKADALADQ